MSGRKLASGPLVVALFATLCMVVFLAPMRSILLWSTILAILFAGTNESLAVRLGGRNRAAAITLVLILLTAVVPFLFITLLIVGQLNELIGRSDEIAASVGQALTTWIAQVPDAWRQQIQAVIESADVSAKDVGGLVMPAISYTFSLGGNIVVFGGTVFAALYVTFFFLRDWRPIVRFLSATVPLEAGSKDILSRRLADTVSATVRGVILVAAAQAIVAGVVYWALGLSAYAVLAAITFIGCLIPAIGSALVWVPVAIYFYLVGDYASGTIMALAGIFVISMVDNILRPRLIAEKAALPDFLIFLSSFGGLAVAGFDGLFLGPIVAAFFVESWNVYLGLSKSKAVQEEAADA